MILQTEALSHPKKFKSFSEVCIVAIPETQGPKKLHQNLKINRQKRKGAYNDKNFIVSRTSHFLTMPTLASQFNDRDMSLRSLKIQFRGCIVESKLWRLRCCGYLTDERQ